MEDKILNIIKAIRESFGASISIYTMGNCYQFYEILKSIFPEAIAYRSGGHVFTKIGDKFYDIKGQYDKSDYDFILLEEHRIESLNQNKYSDEKRLNIKIEEIKKGNNIEYNKEKIQWDGNKLIIKEDEI